MVTDFFDFEGHVFISPTLALRKRSSTNRRGVAGKSFKKARRKLQMGTSSRRTGNSTHFQTQKIVEDLQELKISMKPKRTWKVELLEVDFFWSEMNGILQLPWRPFVSLFGRRTFLAAKKKHIKLEVVRGWSFFCFCMTIPNQNAVEKERFPGDSIPDLLILYLEVTNNLSNGHFFTIPKRAPAEWPGLCFFLFSYFLFWNAASWQVLALHFPGG